MSTWTQILLLFLAGGLGTLSRFAMGSLFTSVFPNSVPWGTAVINVLGCFCFGLIAELLPLQEPWSAQARLVILTGFFGAFTTFSTYMYEMHALSSNGSVLYALAGFLVQNVLGFCGILLGVLLARNCLIS